jgi:hypothetical protein
MTNHHDFQWLVQTKWSDEDLENCGDSGVLRGREARNTSYTNASSHLQIRFLPQ